MLAGGANHRKMRAPHQYAPRPGRRKLSAYRQSISTAPAGAYRLRDDDIPAVAPPANIQRPSGPLHRLPSMLGTRAFDSRVSALCKIMKKALIFDLDNCLAAANEVGDGLFEPAFAAMKRANRGTVSEDTLRRAFADVWRHPLDWVATKYGFSPAMLAAGSQAFQTTAVTGRMVGYGDLASLADLPADKFLVTSGFRRLQESKIRALQLEPLFTAIFVDAIGEPDRLGKRGLFQKILADYKLTPAEVIVIGDNAESEIAAGNRLGIATVQTLRPGVPRAGNATFYIHSLAELKQLLNKLNG